MKNSLLGEYLDYLGHELLSTNTLEAYKNDVIRFLDFLEKRSYNINETNSFTIMEYTRYCLEEGQASSSIARKIISLRKFYKYLFINGTINEDISPKLETIKIEAKLPEVLTVEEVEKLLSMPDGKSFKGLRDKAMLELMYASGIKISELLNLTEEDVNSQFGYLRCKGSKDKERVIPIGKYAIESLQAYLNIRNQVIKEKNPILFLNSRGIKMTRQGFWKIVKHYAQSAEINKQINLYTIRHSFAVHLLENGADMRSIQEFLGYTSISAAQIYTELNKKRKLSEVYKKTHPRA